MTESNSRTVANEKKEPTIHGSAQDVLIYVQEQLTDRISADSSFEYEETEKSRSAGSWMNEKDEYYCVMTIKLRIPMSRDKVDDIVIPLKSFESSNTLETKHNASQFHQDYGSYYYTIEKTVVDSLIAK